MRGRCCAWAGLWSNVYCGSFRQVPKRIVLDIDDTFDAVHGGQQLRLFNAHYDDYGFQPIVVFDAEGRFVTALLRPAKRPKSVGSGRFCAASSARSDGQRLPGRHGLVRDEQPRLRVRPRPQ